MGILLTNITFVLIIVAAVAIHWQLSLFPQSFFHHRYASHGQFLMSKAWEKFWYVYSWIAQNASFLSPKAYGIMHRMHHAFADTPKDPHSPQNYSSAWVIIPSFTVGSWSTRPVIVRSWVVRFVKMMWKTAVNYGRILRGKKTILGKDDQEIPIEDKFTKNLPEWEWFDRFGNSWLVRPWWIVWWIWLYYDFLFSFYPGTVPVWLHILAGLAVLLHIMQGPLHGAIINFGAHEYGYENYRTADTSKNLRKGGAGMMGEEYHNNHHHDPYSPKFSHKKGERDTAWPIIQYFAKKGMITFTERAERSLDKISKTA